MQCVVGIHAGRYTDQQPGFEPSLLSGQDPNHRGRHRRRRRFRPLWSSSGPAHTQASTRTAQRRCAEHARRRQHEGCRTFVRDRTQRRHGHRHRVSCCAYRAVNSCPGKLRYDPTKFGYLGTADSATWLCITSAKSKIKTFEDAQTIPSTMAGVAAGSSTVDYVNMFNALAGTKFKLVSGYKSTAEIVLAIDRGEADGVCGYDTGSLRAQRPEWYGTPLANLIVQAGLEPSETITQDGRAIDLEICHRREPHSCRTDRKPAGFRTALCRAPRRPRRSTQAATRSVHGDDEGSGISRGHAERSSWISIPRVGRRSAP